MNEIRHTPRTPRILLVLALVAALPASARAQDTVDKAVDILPLNVQTLDRALAVYTDYSKSEANSEAAQPALVKCEEKVHQANMARYEAWHEKLGDTGSMDSIIPFVTKRCGGYPGSGTGVYADDPKIIAAHGFTPRQFAIVKERIVAYLTLVATSPQMSPELKAAMKAMGGLKHGYIYSAAERSALDSRIDKLQDAFGSEVK